MSVLFQIQNGTTQLIQGLVAPCAVASEKKLNNSIVCTCSYLRISTADDVADIGPKGERGRWPMSAEGPLWHQEISSFSAPGSELALHSLKAGKILASDSVGVREAVFGSRSA